MHCNLRIVGSMEILHLRRMQPQTIPPHQNTISATACGDIGLIMSRLSLYQLMALPKLQNLSCRAFIQLWCHVGKVKYSTSSSIHIHINVCITQNLLTQNNIARAIMILGYSTTHQVELKQLLLVIII